MKSLRKLHTGKPYVQFERRTEASVRATLRASSDPSKFRIAFLEGERTPMTQP